MTLESFFDKFIQGVVPFFTSTLSCHLSLRWISLLFFEKVETFVDLDVI